VTNAPAATEDAAARLARHVRRGDLVLLEGEMGAGKTTFVRGLARGMGVAGDVMSPTFQLVRVYRGPLQLAHVDLYRVSDAAELGDLGLDELLDQGAVVVEWGERLGEPGATRIHIEVLDEHRRRLRIDPPDEIRTPGHPLRSEEGGAARFHGDPREEAPNRWSW
jgi:tRNA threonylcarbamoyladenosine biosynthesis protein TsaE